MTVGFSIEEYFTLWLKSYLLHFVICKYLYIFVTCKTISLNLVTIKNNLNFMLIAVAITTCLVLPCWAN